MGLGKMLLKLLATACYFVPFASAIAILGIFGYFWAALHRRHVNTPGWVKGMVALALITTLYTLLGFAFTWCCGAKKVFGILGIFLNLLFMGAFIAMAVMTRDGAHRCRGIVNTPVGRGDSRQDAPGLWDYHYACMLNRAAFALSIIGTISLFLACLTQFGLMKHHQREKRYGPTGYTSGTGARAPFWKRGRNRAVAPVAAGGAPMATTTAPHHTTPYDASQAEAGYVKPAGGYHTTTGTAGNF